MTQLTVRDAADRVGVTRQTVFKAIKEGKISATVNARGQKQIDVSELLRVYGRLQSPDDTVGALVDKTRLSPLSSTTAALQLELERAKMLLQVKEIELSAVRERVEELKVREQEAKGREREAAEERLRMLGVIEQQNRLLSAPAPASAKKPAARSSAARPTLKTVPAPAKTSKITATTARKLVSANPSQAAVKATKKLPKK